MTQNLCQNFIQLANDGCPTFEPIRLPTVIMSKQNTFDCETLASVNVLGKLYAAKLFGRQRHYDFRVALRGDKPISITSDELVKISEISALDRTKILSVEPTRRQIIAECIPSLERICRGLKSRYKTSDLLGEAWIECDKAIYAFTNVGNEILSFIHITVRQNLKRYILQNRSQALSSRSSQYLSLLRAMLKAKKVLTQQLEREPTIYDLCNYMQNQFTASDLQSRLEGICAKIASLDFCETQPVVEDFYLSRTKKLLFEDFSLEKALSAASIYNKEREILLERAQNVSIAEIAQRHNMQSNQVKSILQYSRKKLRRMSSSP